MFIEPDVRHHVTEAIRANIHDRRVHTMFEHCFDNTLDTTVRLLDDDTTFVVTGDIPAMWLRDSTAQVRPYLPFARNSPALRSMLAGLVRRQARYVLVDPYANAFNAEPNGAGHQDDRTAMGPWIWERKYELDSLCYPMLLAHLVWRLAGDTSWCDETFAAAMRRAVEVIETERDHEGSSTYRFERDVRLQDTDTLVRDGRGPLTAATGMSWQAFRPSDDACTHGYNVPGNAFAVVALGCLATMARDLLHDDAFAARCTRLAAGIQEGIDRHAVVDHEGDRIWAYEVDGFGNHLVMDDANIPSLLALPMLGYCSPDDPLYLATRRAILSEANPYFATGSAASGIGSPHTPPGHVWPIALAAQGITSRDERERSRVMEWLLTTDAGTGAMHESFDADDPTVYTREWFSWANAMFCEFALDVAGHSLSALIAEAVRR